MRFEISKSIYPPEGKVGYIARDKDGVVRLRADSEEELVEAIAAYNESLVKEAETKAKAKAKAKAKNKGKKDEPTDEETVVEEETPELIIEGATQALTPTNTDQKPQAEATPPPAEVQTEEPKEFLQNELKEQVEEKKKKTTGKSSFWDKLK